MKLFTEYRHLVGLILIAALAFMVVTNLGPIASMGYTLYAALLPLVVGLGIAFVLDIIVYRYEKLYFPHSKARWVLHTRRAMAIVGAILSIVVMVGLVMYLAIPQTIHSIVLAISYMPSLYDRLVHDVLQLSKQVAFIDQRFVDDLVNGKQLLASVSAYGTKWAGSVAATVSDVVSFIVNAVIGFVFSIYLLLNKKELLGELRQFMQAYIRPNTQTRLAHIGEVVNQTFSSFFIGQFLDALILGVLVGVTMAIFQLPYALNIGCVVGLTALVPLIGAYVGAFIGIVMLLIESPLNALIFIVILLVMQQIENNFIYPKIVGDSIGLPGIWVFAAIIVGANLYGVIGILLSVPVVAVLYRLLKEDVHHRLERQKIKE